MQRGSRALERGEREPKVDLAGLVAVVLVCVERAVLVRRAGLHAERGGELVVELWTRLLCSQPAAILAQGRRNGIRMT